MYVCVCISFSQSEFIFSSQHSSLIRLSMSSKVWVFSFVNCYIKSISKCYHMTLAFLCHMCFPSFLPSFLSCCWGTFLLCFFMAKFTLSLWSSSSLSIHCPWTFWPLSCLDFCQYWVMRGMLGCLCLLQQRRFPLNGGPGMGVPDDMNAFFFSHSFPRNLGTFVQVALFIARDSLGAFPLLGAPAVMDHKSDIDKPSLWLVWVDTSLPFQSLVSDHEWCRLGSAGAGVVFLSCLILNGVWDVSLLKLASEDSFGFQLLQNLSQPISWVLVSLTAPRPSEYSLPCSRGFTVAVMSRVHKVAALSSL